WLNVVVFAGSNITLGLFVVLLGLAQAVVLWRIVPQSRATARAGTAAVVVVAGAALFAPHGAWSFLRSMSGAAWLMANALAAGAVVVRARGHRLPALGLALLAAMSYG